MEGIIALLILLLVFILAGVIAAFVALARTGSLMQSVESYRDIIANISTRLAAVANKLSLLERRDAPPVESEPPPEVPELRAAGIVQPLAPAAPPSRPEQLPQAVISPDEVETIEPEDQEPTPLPTPPPLPKPAVAVSAATKPAAHRTTDWTSFESAAGKRWLTWAGVVILFLSAAFFLKHAFDVGWIGPGVQVLLSVIGGVVLLALGEYFLRQEMRPLGRGLIGGGDHGPVRGPVCGLFAGLL